MGTTSVGTYMAKRRKVSALATRNDRFIFSVLSFFEITVLWSSARWLRLIDPRVIFRLELLILRVVVVVVVVVNGTQEDAAIAELFPGAFLEAARFVWSPTSFVTW